jgi:hypothetical protein
MTFIVVAWCPHCRQLVEYEWRSDHPYALAVSLLLGIGILGLAAPAPFVYFRF